MYRREANVTTLTSSIADSRGARRPLTRSRATALVASAALVASLVGTCLTATAANASAPAAAPKGVTTVVSTSHKIFGYAKPGGRPTVLVYPTWHNSALVMPVIQVTPGYFRVRLPGRPNGSTAWIRSQGLYISQTPYHIIVNLRTTHMLLVKYGKIVMNAPVGVGMARYPTPTGAFFVAYYAGPPSPGYGPFVMVTTAHSNTITDWGGTGDAMVAIHGPLGANAAIGTTGAHVSHGCIRMHVYQQVMLEHVPIGTPITIQG
jgi:lipoprotein-anchoring transpeptidase ErfK/SrfK